MEIKGEVIDLAIYGAQGIALGAYEAIHSLCPSRKVCCFIVSERGSNAEMLAGIPVYELKYFSEFLSESRKKNIEILIATPESVMPEIEKGLDACGLSCHVRLTSNRWAKLMGYYYVRDKKYMPLSALPPGYHRAGIKIYMARFYKDKPLSCKYDMPKWMIPIQVGAALCEERIADILDCDGDNISARNGNYSELTALYWMWKNRLRCCPADETAEYYGLAHYRRVLELTEDDILRLADNAVDVVLPYPLPYEPDIETHHEKYVKRQDWEVVLKVLSELEPAYAEIFPEILAQRYLYNYNIVLAKKEVLAEYCSWLFPILARIEELTIPRGADRADRFVGYMGESLETLYFMANRTRFHIVYTGCRFLI